MDDRYELLGEIGRGGMGVVHRARDRRSGAIVAIKTLLLPTEEERARFEREQRLLARLGEADGFVPALESGAARDRPFIVMPFLEGGTLEAHLARSGRMSVAAVLELATSLAWALGRAHALGIVHRDLKPANILFTNGGVPLIADLGLAKHFLKDAPGASLSQSLTQAGVLMGTLRYMAPEQLLDSKSVGPPADVFALGSILYQCLTGEHAFAGADPVTLLTNTEAGKFLPLERHRGDVPPAVSAILLRCLRAKPADRFEDGAALHAALAAVIVARPGRRSTLARVAVVAVVIGAALTGPGILWRRGPTPERPTSMGEWRAIWRSGDARVLALSPPALWEDRDGRLAAPLRGLDGKSQEALQAAFRGDVSLEPDGRVTFVPDLSAVVLVEDNPGWCLAYGPVVAQKTREGLHVQSPGMVGNTRVLLGRAWWREPRIAVSVREKPGEGESWYRSFQVFAGRTPGLAIVGSHGEGELMLGAAVLPFPRRAPHALVFAPGAPAGERVLVDGLCPKAFDDAASAPPPVGPAGLTFCGLEWDVMAVRVTGRVERADVPATALAAVASGSEARVTAAFERDAGLLGGPFVAIGAAGDDLRLELDGDELVLSRGEAVVARTPAGRSTAKGQLALERRAAIVRGTFEGGDASAAIEVADTRPVERSFQASYGSTGPRVRFGAVAVSVLADAPRADANAIRLWREGAALLARITEPRRADGDVFGALGVPRRKRIASDALGRFLEAAAGLESPLLRRDALARAVFSGILAGSRSDAEAAARWLVREEAAVEAAAARLDALERGPSGPKLLDRLLEGYIPLEAAATGHEGQEAVVLAGAAAADVLAPERKGLTELIRGRCAYVRGDGDETIAHYEEAERLGAVSPSVHTSIGDILFERGKTRATTPDEAVPLLERALDRWERADGVLAMRAKRVAIGTSLVEAYSVISRRGLDAGDDVASLEAYLGVTAHAIETARLTNRPGPVVSAEMRRNVTAAAERVSGAGRHGLGAAVLVALVHACGGELKTAPEADMALTMGNYGRILPEGAERDLALYALACWGGPESLAPAPTERPTAMLVHARLKGAPSEALARARREDRTVEHLARLDPLLSGR